MELNENKRQRMSASTNEEKLEICSLPDDVFSVIFSFLPYYMSKYTTKLVCKKWNAVKRIRDGTPRARAHITNNIGRHTIPNTFYYLHGPMGTPKMFLLIRAYVAEGSFILDDIRLVKYEFISGSLAGYVYKLSMEKGDVKDDTMVVAAPGFTGLEMAMLFGNAHKSVVNWSYSYACSGNFQRTMWKPGDRFARRVEFKLSTESGMKFCDDSLKYSEMNMREKMFIVKGPKEEPGNKKHVLDKVLTNRHVFYNLRRDIEDVGMYNMFVTDCELYSKTEIILVHLCCLCYVAMCKVEDLINSFHDVD